jgi:hypothetical protein
MGNIQQSVIRFDPNACAGFSAAPRTGRATDDKVLARHDRIRPIEFLAARYPVIRRLVGELSRQAIAEADQKIDVGEAPYVNGRRRRARRRSSVPHIPFGKEPHHQQSPEHA